MRLLLLPLTVSLLLLGSPGIALADEPHPTGTEILSVLPPGNSGFYSGTGQAQGKLNGNYGPHTDDQREDYWTGKYKSGLFTPPGDAPLEPKPGVRIDRDAKGVPVVRADTDADLWWGAGYAAGQDRLFLADAVRRYARGTYSELVGPSGLQIDKEARQATYSTAEYDAMLKALPASSQTAVTAYAEGLNAWVSKVRADPRLLPAEYALLTTLPEPWTVTDTLAAGVLITRFVASAGGDEFRLVETLRALETALGKTEGRKAFLDLNWPQDTKAPTTVPAADGAFPNGLTRTAAQQRADFDKAADYALSLPPELGRGLSAGVPAIPGKGTQDPDAFPYKTGTAAGAAMTPAQKYSPAESLVAWARSLHGGSYQIAVAPSRTSTGGAMLESAPQLGYSYPATLWELEVHGAGYDARGVSVPGIPTVGIGYGARTAWALTTGNSKTIDTYIETVRRTTAGAMQYQHNGAWKDASCRTETIRYRQAAQGVPFGLPLQSQALEVCRTVHGPVITTSDDGTLARSMQVATWGRELETINGILDWNRVDDLAGFTKAVAKVAWNENVMYADADGNIAYWHPGLHPIRTPGVDTRFPSRGDGSQDWQGLMPRERLPHVINPKQGYLANWNGKPSTGWGDTWFGDPTTARPSGFATRLNSITSQLVADSSVSFADLQRIDWQAGASDHRAQTLVPVVLRLLGTSGLSEGQRQVRDLLAGWNGSAYGPGAGTSAGTLTDATVTDGPAPTAFRAVAQTLVGTLLSDIPTPVLLRYDATNTHVFDATPVDNLVLRVLDPSTSSLTAQHDYLAGRSSAQIVRTSVDAAVAQLVARYGADPAKWRARHPRSPVASLTGVIGPSTTMPFEDRGSWIHLVSYPRAAAVGRPPVTPVAAPPALAATGGSVLVPFGALCLLGAGLLVRRRKGRLS